MVDQKKLEAMLTHLLHETTPTGKLWATIQVTGYPKFTRADVEAELNHAKLNWFYRLLDSFTTKK